jgi:hypothetical protein
MPRPSDTSADVEERMFDIYRDMPIERKLRIIRDSYRTTRLLHAAGCKARIPAATTEEIHRDWIRTTWGEPPSKTFEGGSLMELQTLDNLPILEQALNVFRKLGIPLAVGGSWASTFYGEPRNSQDADITVAPFTGKEEELAKALGAEFYCSVDAMRTANRDRFSFNLLHMPSGFKVDVFVQKDRPYEIMLIARSRPREIPGSNGVKLEIVSPEDIILLKLEWYRLGGEISDQQWRDIRGVLKTQRSNLDDVYLDKWAAELGVADLLTKARQDAV